MKKLRIFLERVSAVVKEFNGNLKGDVIPKVKVYLNEIREGEHDDVVMCLFVLNFISQCIYFMIVWG